MTKTEAIKHLTDIKEWYTSDRDFSYYGDEYHGLSEDENEALNMAIEALEQIENGHYISCESLNKVIEALEQEPTIEQLVMDDIEYLKKIIKKKKELMEKGEWTDADRLELMLCEIQPYSMYWQMGMISALKKAIKLLKESDEE